MSYEIMYAKKFIRLNDNTFIPLILSGSNNCSMFVGGREIRERHWWVLGGLLKKTEEEMLSWAKEALGKGYGTEWFKEGSRWIEGEDIFGFIRNCVKKASSVEEIFEVNPGVSLSSSLTLYDSSKKWGEEGYEKRELYSYFRTTKEIEKWIKEAKEVEKEWGEKGKAYYNFEFSTIKPLKTASVVKDITGPVVCCVRKGKYLTDYDERGYSFCGDIKKALVFEDVETFIATTDLPERIPGYKLMSAKAKEKEKNFYIKVTEGSRAGFYVKKLTSRSLHFSSTPEGAKKFEREKEALLYIKEKLKGRFPGATGFEVRKVEEEEKTI